MHQQLQIAPGVYITDFRKEGQLKGIAQYKSDLTNDVGLLLDDCATIESKCKMLQYSIEQIQQEDKWEEDLDFCEAIEDNWAVIVKLSSEMKEKILRLFELKYHPQDDKIEELLNIDRVQTREVRARIALQKINKSKESDEQIQQQATEKGIYL